MVEARYLYRDWWKDGGDQLFGSASAMAGAASCSIREDDLLQVSEMSGLRRN